jgi:hypothetical protein
MALLDVQRSSHQVGRIRTGQRIEIPGKTRSGQQKTRPARLDVFRFTSPSRPQIEAAAERYEGDVRPWNDGSRREWEVITKAAELLVTVPPRSAVVSSWYEMFKPGFGFERRCDSQREQFSAGPCLCPHAEDPSDEDEVRQCALDREAMSKRNPPEACRRVTRINVMLPDLPGLGVWRLDTGSIYSAMWTGDQGDIMMLARDGNVFLPARLYLEPQERLVRGEIRKYSVPVLDITSTFREVASGALAAGGIKAQLPPAPGEPRKALAAAPPPDLPRPERPGSPGSAHEPEARDLAAGPGQPDAPPMDDDERYKLAQSVADECADPGITAARFRERVAEAKAGGAMEDHICIDRSADEWEQLGERLEWLWAQKAGTP